MKILCVHPGYEMYGADRSFARAVSALQKHYATAEVKIVLPKEGGISKLLPIQNIEKEIRRLLILRRKTLVRSFTKDIFISLHALLAAYRDMRTADLIYINTIVVFDYILMARFIAKPVVVHVREIPNGIELVIFRMLLLWSRARLIYNSEATRNAFQMPSYLLGRVVYNGVDVAVPKLNNGQPTELKAQVLMIGRLNHWKGQEILLEAIAQMTPAERAKILVRIVGSTFNNQNDFLTRIECTIDRKQLSDVVRIDPFEADPSSSYQRADLVVVPSRLPEPFGCVAIEAMAHAKPVVASRHGGLTEIVRDNETGRLFAPGNAADLCAQLRDFLHHRDVFRSYGAAGRRRYEALFTTKQSNDALISAINELVFIRVSEG